MPILSTALLGAAFSFAAAAQSRETRPPEWGSVNGWRVERGSGAECLARNSHGPFALIAGAAPGTATLIALDSSWATAQLGAVTFRRVEPGNKEKFAPITIASVLVDHPDAGKALALVLTPQSVAAFSGGFLQSYEVFAGKAAKGAAIGTYLPGSVPDAVAMIRSCSKSLAIERAAAPLHQDPLKPLRWDGAMLGPDDYPSSALRAESQGYAGVRLEFAEDGYPEHCDVIATSGSLVLDGTTCRIFQTRLRVAPPLDAKGQPTRATYETGINWRIPGSR